MPPDALLENGQFFAPQDFTSVGGGVCLGGDAKMPKIVIIALLGTLSAACAVAPETAEQELPSESNSAVPSGAGQPEQPPRPESFVGQLRSSFNPAARSRVCIGLGAEGQVESMDEHRCTELPDNELGPVSLCANCVIEYRATASGEWMLAADLSRDCREFAGSYLLAVDPTQACSQRAEFEEGCPNNEWWLCE